MPRPPSRLILALALSLATTLSLLAQSVTFAPVNLPPGLAPGWINDLKQDRQGYLWVATLSGLLRYDGYDWTTFLNDSKSPNSVASNQIESVCPTRDGLVWVGTKGLGLDCLDPETGKITHYQLANRKSYNQEENFITVLREDRQGTLWIGTHHELYRRVAKTGRFTHYAPRANDPTSLSHPQVRAIYQDHQETLWVSTGETAETTPHEGGLNKLDPQTGRFTRYLHDPADPHSLVDNLVRAIFEDSRGTFWVGTAGDGLHTMDRK